MSNLSNSEREIAIAHSISDGRYDWRMAKFSAELQGLSFENVISAFGLIYEQEQMASEGYYHG